MLHELAIVLALILANGFFSGAEMAIVASRRGRLRQLADQGDAGAATALELGAPLLTGNVRHFAHIASLQVEGFTA